MANKTVQGPELESCSIALKCANEPSDVIERCLDSIDDDVNVHVAMTPNGELQELFEDRGIDFTVTEYGNIAKSAEISVSEAVDDHVIVLDSDTWFLPGSIRRLRESLKSSVITKPRIEFLTDTWISKVIASKRRPFYDRPDYPANPGLAFRKNELREAAGGQIFNPDVRWTEDADLNFRLKLSGVSVSYVPEAVLMHDAITLRHELRTAFYYGIGKRLSVEQNPDRPSTEDFPGALLDFMKELSPSTLQETAYQIGVPATILSSVWRAIYLGGYNAQKHFDRWSVDK